ncbi:MAG TPA: CDP-alcohol phosphatidyltransferase family protein [Chloroflexota bacterium]
MFPKQVQLWARRLAERLVKPLAPSGLTPNAVTVVGFILNILTAVILASGHLSIGGIFLFVSGLFDLLDGALARVTGQHSDFGAFLDSILDRYSEAAILLALIYVFTIHGETAQVLLVYIVAIGSIMISYARARAGALRIDCKVGIAPRPERVLILGFGLLLSGFLGHATTTVAALIILALLTHITAMQRLHYVWRQTEGQKNPGSSAQPSTKARESRIS